MGSDTSRPRTRPVHPYAESGCAAKPATSCGACALGEATTRTRPGRHLVAKPRVLGSSLDGSASSSRCSRGGRICSSPGSTFSKRIGLQAFSLSQQANRLGSFLEVNHGWKPSPDAVGRSRAGTPIRLRPAERASLYPVLVVTVKSSKCARTPWPNRRSDVGMDTLRPQAAASKAEPPGQTSNHPHW
jgi:hypothetical protein